MGKIKATLVSEKVMSNSAEAQSLFATSRFGEKLGEKILYSLSEALFLVQNKKMELADYKNIRGRGQPSDWHEILCQGNLGNVLCGFVLRGDGEPNSEQASRLMAQIKQIYVKSLLSKDGFREN